MSWRRIRRAGYAAVGGYLLVNLLLNARPVLYVVVWGSLPAEMRDGKAASLAVTKAILAERLALATETYQSQLEIGRRGYEIELSDEQLLQLDEDLWKAKTAMDLAWLEWAAA